MGQLLFISQLLLRGRRPKPSALIDAAENGEIDGLRRLLDENHDINTRNPLFRIVQMQAALFERLKFLKELKDCRVDELAVDQEGKTVLHLAVGRGLLSIVEMLLQAYPPSGEQLKTKLSRLERAAEANTTRHVSRSLLDTSVRYGCKPLHLAVKSLSSQILKMLLHHGSNQLC